ncbi:MAG: RNA-splicing ligase RtcB [Deltaproteobacteria bacterium HGW-Deltaproteobacteria-19]|jgi:tRNA-splicing ligase RtcB|nr:MAG: RNA-splicing ligase RtcB [Deltaproteobacteria bacterium HGW-Deltaproteobacteria-19]
MSDIPLTQIDEFRWKIEPTGGMRVPGIIYSSRALMKTADEGVRQVANVAHLPGIVKASLAMPDMHWGYGFPIGGVAAFDLDEGVVSPGGVGYDINCGCRLVATRLSFPEIRESLKDLVAALFRNIPSGVGSTGVLKLSEKEQRHVLVEGARWAVGRGYGTESDLETTEDGGCLAGADPEKVSPRALERGRPQLGTLGSGNHFLEIEVVEDIFDPEAARAFGLERGQVTVMIHSGSRGLGYQVCDDFLARLVKHVRTLDLNLPDRQLACAYLHSPQGKDYLAAMACAANYAWANRQMLMHWTRETFERTLKKGPRELGMRLLYDVCHNIAKIETLPVEGRERTLCVHRKGATRAYPPGHPALPDRYRAVGQPVLIPGDMGTGSYVLAGTERAMAETFGSSCHGAGRVMSRTQAVKSSRGRAVARELAERGILVMASGKETLREEIPEAYKDLDAVVDVVHRAGLARKVARLRAVGCIKG